MARDLSADDSREPNRGDLDARKVVDVVREREQEIEQRHAGRAFSRPERPNETPRPAFSFVDGRAVLYDRDRGYRLTETQIRTIRELGRFRIVAGQDLGRHAYGEQQELARSDAQYLIAQGLVRKATFDGPEAAPRLFLTLSERGRRLVRANLLIPRDQPVYHGFIKPKDANHDADLYQLFHREATRIEAEGGKNIRVILDYELKGKVNQDTARYGLAAKPEIAERYGLRMVHNKIPVPDLQIEYETREGDIARVNLELVTEHYGGRSIAEKVRAGFRLFAPSGEADRLRRVLDQQELTAEILSL
jgi:hypothetical protein